MIPTKAFPVAISLLKTLYKGKKKIGKGSAFLASKAGKAGWSKTSKAITGLSNKTHKGTRALGKFAKRNPKEASFYAGIGTTVAVNKLFSDD